ncbi:hypothetical protein HUG10_21290 (plasmid) [Halorarum halophilum]|uniref:Uncharacterized protein n=1 Tax=Halorarum halophilum TaxID=2743090 RepID=A0A7D5GQ28_9EURY|nr:hypothetical protein [Halobaculum halophilum]QLG30124.1 hypothetical protein HUG10_21290 [Halobaculum halophilum]
MEAKDIDDIPDELIEKVINTQGFQKMVKYSQLADSVEVLEDDDSLFNSLVKNITSKHKNGISEESTREFFALFVEEVQTFTEPLVDDDGGEIDSAELEDLYVEE